MVDDYYKSRRNLSQNKRDPRLQRGKCVGFVQRLYGGLEVI